MARIPDNIILDETELFLWILRSENRLSKFLEVKERYAKDPESYDNYWKKDLFGYVQFSEHHCRHHEYVVTRSWGGLHLKKKSLVLDPKEVTSLDQEI